MEPSDEAGREGEEAPRKPVSAQPVQAGRADAPGVDLDIGPRVTAVFTAAEKAAQHIVTMAREEAEDVRRRAEAEADSLLSQRRYQAEEEAARLLAETRAQADQIRAAAEEEARQIEEAARRRELRIREETRLLEERVDWARDGLREVADRLQSAEAHFTVPAGASARPDEPEQAEPTREPASELVDPGDAERVAESDGAQTEDPSWRRADDAERA